MKVSREVKQEEERRNGEEERERVEEREGGQQSGVKRGKVEPDGHQMNKL